MMSELQQHCDAKDATYCMNGGTCYRITSMNTLTCVCNVNYKGSRCELLHLFTSSTEAEQAGLIAAVVIVAIFVIVLLSVIIYLVHKRMKAKRETQKNIKPEYWKVQSRKHDLP